LHGLTMASNTCMACRHEKTTQEGWWK